MVGVLTFLTVAVTSGVWDLPWLPALAAALGAVGVYAVPNDTDKPTRSKARKATKARARKATRKAA